MADTKKDAGDLGQSESQAKKDEEEAKGFYGDKVDPTPNENYSLETPPDAPTPETDPKLAAKASERSAALGRGEEVT